MQLEIPMGEGIIKEQEYYYPSHTSNLYGQFVDVIKVDRQWVEDVARGAGVDPNGYLEAQTLTVDNMNGQYGNDIHVNSNMWHNHEVTFNGEVKMNTFNSGQVLEQITTEDSQAEAYTKINEMIVALNRFVGHYELPIDHTKIEESELVEGESELEKDIDGVIPKGWPGELNESRVEIDESLAKQFNESVAFDGIKELIGE